MVTTFDGIGNMMKKTVASYGIAFCLMTIPLVSGCGNQENPNAGKSPSQIVRETVATAGEKLDAGMEANDISSATAPMIQLLDGYETSSFFKPYEPFYANLERLQDRAKTATEDELKQMVDYVKKQAEAILANTPG